MAARERTANNRERTFQFSRNIITYLRALPRDYIFYTIGKQVLRSATSVGANVTEAQAGRTRKDFTNYYTIALKSANETAYWLALLRTESTKRKATCRNRTTRKRNT